MKKFKKLLGDTFPDFIDLFYGIAAIRLAYYEIFIGIVGIFYLSNFVQSNILKSIMGEVPIEFIGAEFQKGTFSQSVMSCFLIYIAFRLLCLLLTSAFMPLKVYSIIYEFIVGAALVLFDINRNPIVTPDEILRFVCFFMIIKLGLMIITRIFKISTRHFGSFEKDAIIYKQAFAVAVGKSEGKRE